MVNVQSLIKSLYTTHGYNHVQKIKEIIKSEAKYNLKALSFIRYKY